MAVERRLMTAEELLRLADDGMRRELVDGEVRTMPPAGWEHGMSAGGIHANLGRYLIGQPVAAVFSEAGFLLGRDPDRLRVPDVAVVRTERLPPEGTFETYFPGAPDLAVEVVSPGDAAADVLAKVVEWLQAGARAVWLVYRSPVRLLVYGADGSVQMLGPDDEVDGADLLPGFRMRVSDLLHPYRR